MSCDPAVLLSEASCFQCLPAGQQQLAELALLCQISTGGGAGGGGGISHGIVDPVAAPTNPNVDNLYINTVGIGVPSYWLWPAGGAAWQQIG